MGKAGVGVMVVVFILFLVLPFLVFPFFVSSGNSVALALRPVPCATGARRVRVCVALPAAVPLDAIHGVVRIGS